MNNHASQTITTAQKKHHISTPIFDIPCTCTNTKTNDFTLSIFYQNMNIILFLLPFLVNSFSQVPNHQHHKILFSTSSNTLELEKQTNIFQSYEKPIVLIGTSSNNELNKLGNYFSKEVISPKSYKNPKELLSAINNQKIKCL